MTAVCTYDNPKTMRRECWQDGEIICWYFHKLFSLKHPPCGVRLFFGANIGDWVTGQMVGDPDAIAEENSDEDSA